LRLTTKPRKKASQLRSCATVDALINATARILVTDGFDKVSTNRIAHIAGVSVGSLYQYFPNREALVAAVIKRHRGDLRAVVQSELKSVASQPLAQGIRTIVATSLKVHLTDPRLHRVLSEETPRIGRFKNVATFGSENFEQFRELLETHKNELGSVNLDLATFLCVTMIEAVTHNAILHNTEFLKATTTDVLINETSRLVMRYLVVK
jgi:AcrR family transcriptional regulator